MIIDITMGLNRLHHQLIYDITMADHVIFAHKDSTDQPEAITTIAAFESDSSNFPIKICGIFPNNL